MPNLIKKSPEGQHDPEADFFPFKQPMTAPGREQNWLGCAFAHPKQGSKSPYMPQGDTSIRNEHAKSKLSESTPDTQASKPVARSKPIRTEGDQDTVAYNSPCGWPRDLTDKEIYPDSPTIAMGVQAIQEKYHNAGGGADVLDSLKALFNLEKHQLETVEIPYFRRYNMEDAEGKIKDLLECDDYRHRLVDLFNKQTTKGYDPELYIATGLIACGKMSINKVKENDVNAEVSAADPSNTVPVKVEGHWHYVKKSSVSGTYENDVIFAMAYHQIKYECVPKQSKVNLWERTKGVVSGGPKGRSTKLDKLAERYQSQKEDHTDFFWVSVESSKGGFAPWFGGGGGGDDGGDLGEKEGEKSDPKVVRLLDPSTIDNNKVEPYPSGFFTDLSMDDFTADGTDKRTL